MITVDDQAAVSLLTFLDSICPFNIFYLLVGIVLLFIIGLFTVAIIATNKGNEFSFCKITIKPHAKYNDLKQAYQKLVSDFEELDCTTKQNAQWLKLLSKVNRDILYVESNSETVEDFIKGLNRIIILLLTGVVTILTSGREDVVRAAVFIQDGDNLRIYQGAGYSVEGTQKLRLPLSTSVIGKAFTECKEYYIPDVTKSPDWSKHPKATKNYHSLCCIPICINDVSYAVLNVDGESVDAFSQDERDGLTLVSRTIALLFYHKEFISNRISGS